MFGYLDECIHRRRRCALPYGMRLQALPFHDRQIAYRDLKPENLLSMRAASRRLSTLGSSSCMKARRPGHCGTPEYLAPEVILRKGHDSTCDWWSLGVLLIEMLYGSSPFVDDITGVFRRIVKGELEGVPAIAGHRRACPKPSHCRSHRTIGCGHDGGRAIAAARS